MTMEDPLVTYTRNKFAGKRGDPRGTVTMGELERLYNEGETRGMLAAAKLICVRCRRDEPIVIRGDSVEHKDGPCVAWKIRKEPRLLEFNP